MMLQWETCLTQYTGRRKVGAKSEEKITTTDNYKIMSVIPMLGVLVRNESIQDQPSFVKKKKKKSVRGHSFRARFRRFRATSLNRCGQSYTTWTPRSLFGGNLSLFRGQRVTYCFRAKHHCFGAKRCCFRTKSHCFRAANYLQCHTCVN